MTTAAAGTVAGSTTITLPVLPFKQGGYQLFLTAIPAAELPRFTSVDVFDASQPVDAPDQGYQRAAEMPRVKKFANWLKRSVQDGESMLMPTSILLSARDVDLRFNELTREITLSTSKKLRIVDGQHRTEGFRYAVIEKGLHRVADMEIPVVVVQGIDRLTEMRQFAIVNGTQKSVRTDLVNMILTQLAASEGDDAIRESDLHKVVISRATQTLNDATGSPWENMIVMPNEKSPTKSEIKANLALGHQKLVRATSFMTSLKPLYDVFDRLFWQERLSTEARATELAEVVQSFWTALRELNPTVFEHPGDHVMQKTPGLFSLHSIAKGMVVDMFRARRPFDAENFKVMLEPCDELAEPGFWNAKEGPAARYGSMKGFAELAGLLTESLRS